MKMRLTVLIQCLVAGLLLAHTAGPTAGPPDSDLVVIPFDVAMTDPTLAGYRGCVISEDKVLVAVPGEARSVISRRGFEVLGRTPRLRLWKVRGRVSPAYLEARDAALVYRMGGEAVIEADAATAEMLSRSGPILAELKMRSLAELAAPTAGERLAADLLRDRPLEAERMDFITDLVARVDTARMRRDLEFLCYDDQGGPRSRYACRADLNRDIAPVLLDSLRAHLEPNGGTALTSGWQGVCDTFPQHDFLNLIGSKPGRTTGAHYIVCAHYDAIASHNADWDPYTSAAPGADDNGTGVVVMLECLRLLADIELDVGLKFVAFTAEEIGVRGSQHYVQEISPTDSVIGVLNIDMVGYYDAARLLEVCYDWKSAWISDQLVELGDSLNLESDLEPVNLSGLLISDQARFWTAGIPGILLIEELDETVPVNPYYHSSTDTPEHLDMTQIADNARLLVAYLARFASMPGDTLSDIVLHPGSVDLDWDGRNVNDLDDRPIAGGELRATVRALNAGATMDTPLSYRFEIWRGERSSGTLLHESTETMQLVSGAYAKVSATWDSEVSQYGNVSHTVVLLPVSPAEDRDSTDNVVQVAIEAMSEVGVLRNLHVYPNPIEDPRAARLTFDIFHPDADDFKGAMEVWFYDMLGREIGCGRLENSFLTTRMEAGEGVGGDEYLNVYELSEFLSPQAELAPGLYLCIARLRFLGEPDIHTARFRFAVAR